MPTPISTANSQKDRLNKTVCDKEQSLRNVSNSMQNQILIETEKDKKETLKKLRILIDAFDQLSNTDWAIREDSDSTDIEILTDVNKILDTYIAYLHNEIIEKIEEVDDFVLHLLQILPIKEKNTPEITATIDKCLAEYLLDSVCEEQQAIKTLRRVYEDLKIEIFTTAIANHLKTYPIKPKPIEEKPASNCWGNLFHRNKDAKVVREEKHEVKIGLKK